MIEQIPASRCPRCQRTVAPPAAFCPYHPVAMTPTSVPGVGEIVAFTTLHAPPEGFRAPLHIALVELEGGARFVCHGAETRGLRVGARVAIEAVEDVYYFSHLSALERVRLFWRRAGWAGDRLAAMGRSVVKRMFRSGSKRGAGD